MKNYVILKSYCRYIFFVGTGNFWYEEGCIGDDRSILYRMYQVILFSMYIFMTILEIMAITFGDFPKDEKSDATAFSVCHSIVLLKMYHIIRNRDLIKSLNKKMVEICDKYEGKSLMDEKLKMIKINFAGYFIAVYGCMVCFIYEGFRKWNEGSHFVTVVTYYPAYEDNSVLASLTRVATTFILILMLMTMIISLDFFTVAYLIMFKYKIITLRKYLEDVRTKFDRENLNNTRLASINLRERLQKGIEMHAGLLSLCKEIDKAFGMVISLQLCMSTSSVVSLLLQIALLKDVTFVIIIKVLLFVASLFFLLGLFLCNAGEITYQASLLSDAFFYCGWHACAQNRSVGGLVLLAVMRSQRPLAMKAFKMIELTYATFITVLRTTYSVFALIYAQNE